MLPNLTKVPTGETRYYSDNRTWCAILIPKPVKMADLPLIEVAPKTVRTCHDGPRPNMVKGVMKLHLVGARNGCSDQIGETALFGIHFACQNLLF